MKKWLILAWLMIPVGLLSYHYGPGQQALAYRDADKHVQIARQLERDGHFEEAIDEYGASLVSLPFSDNPSPRLNETRDRLRLAQIRGRFQLGQLAETIRNLNELAASVDQEHGPHSALAYDIREFLGRVHFRAMVALRLEAAEKETWLRHWELARQNYRFLAENTSGRRNQLERKNLEVVIKSFNNPVPPTAAAAANGTSTAELNTVLAPPPPTPTPPAEGAGPPTIPDARPREPTPESPDPVAREFRLGS